ncbi:MAG TPA: glycine reductase, partial [Bacillota bacterium]|nr:glycine reductase [Bacillota bacterium]
MDKEVRKIIGGVFKQIAEGLETGSFAGKIRVGLTTLGSELGDKELIRGAEIAASRNPSLEVVLIGSSEKSSLKTIPTSDEKEMHERMEAL